MKSHTDLVLATVGGANLAEVDVHAILERSERCRLIHGDSFSSTVTKAICRIREEKANGKPLAQSASPATPAAKAVRIPGISGEES